MLAAPHDLRQSAALLIGQPPRPHRLRHPSLPPLDSSSWIESGSPDHSLSATLVNVRGQRSSRFSEGADPRVLVRGAPDQPEPERRQAGERHEHDVGTAYEWELACGVDNLAAGGSVRGNRPQLFASLDRTPVWGKLLFVSFDRTGGLAVRG